MTTETKPKRGRGRPLKGERPMTPAEEAAAKRRRYRLGRLQERQLELVAELGAIASWPERRGMFR